MFCMHCGAQLPDGASFCCSCGKRIGEVTGAAAEEITLTIDRSSQIYLINPPVKVLVDGRPTLSVDNGKTESVQLPRGSHTIEFKAGIAKNTVEIPGDSDTLLEIGFNRITGGITVKIR